MIVLKTPCFCTLNEHCTLLILMKWCLTVTTTVRNVKIFTTLQLFSPYDNFDDL